MALWWSYLHVFGLGWDRVSLAQVGGFLAWLRSGDGPELTSIVARPSRFPESTIATRLRAVTSCYRFHELNGVRLGGDLVRLVRSPPASARSRPTRRTSTTCSNWTAAPTGHCPTAGACCRHGNRVTAGTLV